MRRTSTYTLNILMLGCLLALGACGGDDTTTPTQPDVIGGEPDVTEPEPDTTPEPDATPEPDTAPEPDTTPEPDVVPEPTAVCGDGICDPTEDCATCAEDCPACPPVAGALLITEIMQNPKAVVDSEGEWIEIQNIGDEAVELSGVVLRDDAQDHHVITPDTSLVIAAGAYAVLGKSDNLGVGIEADYVFVDFDLGNGADSVMLEVDDVLIDAVIYDGGPAFPDPNGASMSLDPSATTTAANDLAPNWCAGTTTYGDGDLGTPGADNPVCTDCGDGTCEEGEACETCPEDCGSCTPCDQGATATDETCNGVDDDCDGTLDEATCDDGIDCTEDYCDGASGCAAEPYDHACLIAGTCYLDGDDNPANGCEVCDPSASSDSWASKLFSLSCSDGDPCTNDDLCVLGFCLGSSVEDAYEPNDAKGDATVLGQIKDDNDFPAGNFTASLFGEGDSDWYTYFIEDVFLTQFHPRAELSDLNPNNVYRMCVFSTCANGELPQINSCEGGVEWIDPNAAEPALAGCCTTGSEDLMLKLSLGCSLWGLADESGDVHVHVEQLSGDWTCDEYTLTWGDD